MDIASFWERTNQLIKSQKTTQRALSVNCGFAFRRIESLVSLNRMPDGIETYRIAQALNTSVEFLITGKEPDTKPRLDSVKAHLKSALDELNTL